jgi:hypothetical protein
MVLSRRSAANARYSMRQEKPKTQMEFFRGRNFVQLGRLGTDESSVSSAVE